MGVSLPCECGRAAAAAEALSAVRATPYDAGLDPALRRSWGTEARSVVGRPSRPRGSSLRSSPRGRDGNTVTLINGLNIQGAEERGETRSKALLISRQIQSLRHSALLCASAVNSPPFPFSYFSCISW